MANQVGRRMEESQKAFSDWLQERKEAVLSFVVENKEVSILFCIEFQVKALMSSYTWLKKKKSYLCIGLDYVALYLIHRVYAVGHGAQVQPLENHFVLCQSSCTSDDKEQQILALSLNLRLSFR